MRKVVYVLLAIFLVVFIVTVGLIGLLAKETVDVVAPIGDLFGRLAIPATPVILPDPVTIVRELNDLARLETAEYVADKLIRAERDQDFMWGAFGETLLFRAYGNVIAGVDLTRMEAGDIQVVSPTKVMIYLPEAEILVATLDNDSSYVINRDVGIGTALSGSVDVNLETEVRQRAEAEIEQAAIEAGVLDTANENAQFFMRSFLQGLGFTEVVFTDAPPPPAAPYEQPLPKGQVLVTPTPEAP